MPLISVIINVYNGAATLREAVNSVLAQTFADWELVIWDDGSTDGSAAIVAEYRDSRIRYFFSPEQVSLGQARNEAIKLARGAWIAFLDQDDIWLPQKLEKQVALIGDDVGLIYGRTVRFYPDGRERDYDHAHEYEFLPEGNIFHRLFSESCFIAMSSAMFRRSAIEAIGGIPELIRIIPDYYLYVAVSPVPCLRCAGSRLPLSHARRQHVSHDGSRNASGGFMADRSLGAGVGCSHRRPLPETAPDAHRS